VISGFTSGAAITIGLSQESGSVDVIASATIMPTALLWALAKGSKLCPLSDSPLQLKFILGYSVSLPQTNNLQGQVAAYIANARNFKCDKEDTAYMTKRFRGCAL
jgi:hypothetical protein